MQELRFVAVSEDGSYAVLAVPGRSARFTLPIDERLRAVALGQTSRLAQYEIEVESPLRPKEIQARIRAGETAEEIADAAGIPLERVRWFEGPVLAERAYIADQAQAATVRRPGDSAGPGPRLGDIVPSRLSAAGADPDEGQWDSRKRGDSSWQVTLTFTSGGRLHVAEWVFDPRRRHVMPDDDNAVRLSLPDAELPPLSVPLPGEATVTPLAPRLGAVSAGGMVSGPLGGNGGAAGGGRFRSERPGTPDRPAPAASPVLPRPGQRDPVPERPDAAPAASFDDSERTRPAPQRPLVFEEPDPASFDARPEPEPVTAPPAPAARPQEQPMPAPTAPAPARESVSAGLPRPAQPERTAAPAKPGQRAATPEPQVAYPEPATAQPEPAAAAPPAAAPPAAAPPAAARSVAAEPEAPWPAAAVAAPVAASAEPAEHAADEHARGRPGKKNARGRRSSVPSWDEIMLGSSPKRD